MQAKDHLYKAARIERSRVEKLDASDDYELVIWSCIHGGAHLLNAALHASGVTEETHDFIRSGVIDPDLRLPERVSAVVKSLQSVDALSAKFVRGAQIPDEETVKSCIDSYNAAKAIVEQLVGRPYT